MNLPENSIIFIDRAERLRDFVIRLAFNDGTEQTIDFGPFILNSKNPCIHPYADPNQFAQFRVEGGDLLWGDYDLCFLTADLYEGRI